MSSWLSNGLRSLPLRLRVGSVVGSVPQHRHISHYYEGKVLQVSSKIQTSYFHCVGAVHPECHHSLRLAGVRHYGSSQILEQTTSSNKDEATTTQEEVTNSESNASQSSETLETVPPSVTSMSQTGEQLPSEVEDSEKKFDKLYKVIELEVLSYEPAVLDSYQWFVITAAHHLGIQVGKCYSNLKPEKLRFKLLKSAFVHKKHVVHYEVRTHHRFLTFLKLTSSTADTFLEYIERNLPEGVGLKVTRVEAKPLPDYVQTQAQVN